MYRILHQTRRMISIALGNYPGQDHFYEILLKELRSLLGLWGVLGGAKTAQYTPNQLELRKS